MPVRLQQPHAQQACHRSAIGMWVSAAKGDKARSCATMSGGDSPLLTPSGFWSHAGSSISSRRPCRTTTSASTTPPAARAALAQAVPGTAPRGTCALMGAICAPKEAICAPVGATGDAAHATRACGRGARATRGSAPDGATCLAKGARVLPPESSALPAAGTGAASAKVTRAARGGLA